MLHAVTPYGRTGGSSRVRVHEWTDRTSASCSVSDYIGHRNASPRYLAGHVRQVAEAERALRRLAAATPSRLLLHREASPLSRGGLEQRLLRSAEFAVYDLDDALHEDHGQGGLLRRWAPKSRKAQDCACAAERVIAGIPCWPTGRRSTAEMLSSSPAALPLSATGPRPTTLSRRSPAGLDRLARQRGAPPDYCRSPARTPPSRRRTADADRHVQPRLGALEALVRVAWSENVQHESLADADVGLMPLPDDPYSRGKCAYKLLQYAAVAIPFVASPVGVNAASCSSSACQRPKPGMSGFPRYCTC